MFGRSGLPLALCFRCFHIAVRVFLFLCGQFPSLGASLSLADVCEHLVVFCRQHALHQLKTGNTADNQKICTVPDTVSLSGSVQLKSKVQALFKVPIPTSQSLITTTFFLENPSLPTEMYILTLFVLFMLIYSYFAGGFKVPWSTAYGPKCRI